MASTHFSKHSCLKNGLFTYLFLFYYKVKEVLLYNFYERRHLHKYAISS